MNFDIKDEFYFKEEPDELYKVVGFCSFLSGEEAGVYVIYKCINSHVLNKINETFREEYKTLEYKVIKL